MTARVRIAAVGEVDEDVYLPEGDPHLGGISANFARAAQWAGAEVALYAAVGDDPRGARVRGCLAALGLDRRVRTEAGVTASQRIRIADGGERVFCGFEPGVGATYRLSADELAELSSYDAIAVPCSPESAGVFAQVAGRSTLSRKLVADFSQDSAPGEAGRPDRWIAPHTDVLGAAFVGGAPDQVEDLAELSRACDALLVLTAGAAGAWGMRRGRVFHQPSLAGRIVDTTGCGDAFAGAVTVAHVRGASVEEALRAGAECAALVASRRGGGPAGG